MTETRDLLDIKDFLFNRPPSAVISCLFSDFDSVLLRIARSPEMRLCLRSSALPRLYRTTPGRHSDEFSRLMSVKY